jgi:hypothetical protein
MKRQSHAVHLRDSCVDDRMLKVLPSGDAGVNLKEKELKVL